MRKLTDEQIARLVKVFIIFALTYFAYGIVYADTIKVAVIDSGYDFDSKWESARKIGLSVPKLCKKHYNFTKWSYVKDGAHGTHIAGLIAKGLDTVNYCIGIYKYYDSLMDAPNQINENKAIERAIADEVNIINISGGGIVPNKEE